MKVINVVGARPNFMKIAPIHEQMILNSTTDPLLIHTGQHYDEKMSKVFFDDLNLPKPDIYLGVGSSNHGNQTGKIMIEFEKVLLNHSPDLVLVVGDVNSTLASAINAVKLNIPVAHVEAGLRSFDRSMPEEINRILTDAISDYLFVSEKSGLVNLKNEGINKGVYFVGNVMIDSLIKHINNTKNSNILEKIGVKNDSYGLITLHRPVNVDNKNSLQEIFEAINEIQKTLPLIFPMHPRTKKNIIDFNLVNRMNSMDNLFIIDPVGYYDFLRIMKSSKLVLTDSGGIQEETAYLGIQCLTLRTSTERPSTLDCGTNTLVKLSCKNIINAYNESIKKDLSNYDIPELWDGKTAKRIVNIIVEKQIEI